MRQLLRARRLLTERGWLDDHQIHIEDGIIAEIEPIPSGVIGHAGSQLATHYRHRSTTRYSQGA